jgi:hypothetical protein
MTPENRFRFRRGAIALCFLLAGGALAEAEDATFCAIEDPEEVLACLERAYEQFDRDAYGRLFSRDFVYEFPGEGSWGYEEEMASAAGLFDTTKTAAIDLAVEPGYRIEAGDSPDAWSLHGVTLRLSMDLLRPGESGHVASSSLAERIDIRRRSEPTPHFEIVRWVQGPPIPAQPASPADSAAAAAAAAAPAPGASRESEP